MAKTISVFVSYSWKLEDESHFLDGLGEQCHLRNIKLIRDAKTLQPGERISKFMERIAGASYVITVFSQRYFESEYCLYELMNVLQYKGLEQKIYPVMADDLKLDDAAAITKLVQHWKQKRDELEALVIKNGVGINPALDERLNLYQEFVIKIGKLMKQAGDILAVQTTTCNEQKYSSVLDLICPLYQIPPAALFLPTQSDQEFMAAIRLRMVVSLSYSSILRKAIVEQLKLNGTAEAADKLADILVERCADEDTLGRLLRNDIFRATRLSLQALSGSPDKDSPAVIKDVDQLTNSADTLFSCLVLYAIRDDWMDKYRQGCASAGSNLRHMPFETITAVEIVTSRHLQRIPTFSLTSSDAVGKEGFVVPEHGFEKDDIVTGILRQVWVKVFPEDLPENYQESKLRRLGSQIRNRHQRQDEEKNNYYCIVSGDSNHPLSDPDVRAELTRKLPDLPLIILRTEDCQDVLVIPDDADLASLIFDFYQMLNKYRPYEPEKDH
ncbi:TIR domain-containing protein [Thiothrix caldifontis]|uniref:TIR domain-containing protein n=1 Tax=Thiothrix caldifontis TaxID=525918 RepID=A0A1H4DWL9_9GAMM|nr:toll/interleukin-1 receptor domain-containing protein [Thiothrix caldifontis]SEA76780.1 TIR domain-containing protein [Thiothrix caldifontis]